MGASSGIGLELAEVLASRGVPVGLAARHTRALAALKQKYPDNVEFAAIDINTHTAPKHMEELIDKLGGMDIYFHVSGIGNESTELDAESETAVAETNAVGFTRMIDTAYRYFADNNRSGQIVAIGSVAGTKGIGQLAAYSASKAYVSKYLSALRQLANMQGARIAFTEIRPGWIRTPLLDEDAQYPMTMEVEDAVRDILRAAVLRKRIAVIDWRWRALVAAWKMVPDCVWEKYPYTITLKRKTEADPKPAVETSASPS